MIPGLGEWLEKIQIGTAVRTLSLFSIVIWLIITLIFGRIYCSSVCPLGTLQDIAARSTRMGRRARRHPYRYTRPSNSIRYLFLGIMAAGLIGGLFMITSILDPYTAYHRISEGFFKPLLQPLISYLQWLGISRIAADITVSATVTTSIIATVLFIIATLIPIRKGRLLCNTICPVGTTLGFVSRFSIFQIDIDTDKCIQCRRCEEVCKSCCIDLTDHVVDGSRCVNCFDCINVCPNDAIHYTARRKQLSEPMMQRITGLTSRAGTSVSGATDTAETTSETQ